MNYTGIVQKGDQQGEVLGFRTVNIPLRDTAVSGVYTAKVKVGDESYEAVAFADQVRKVLEAHLLDFPDQGRSASGGSVDLYGWKVTIVLLKKIRERKQFSDDEKLKRAIARDIEEARAYFREK